MKLKFDNNWKFHLGDHDVPKSASAGVLKAGLRRGFANPETPDNGWRRLELPHDWMIEANPVPWEMKDQGYYPRGIGWYRKSFDLPDDIENKKIFIEFDGIARNASAWINGFYLGNHPSGYTPFICDITDFVPRYLFQETDNPQPNGLQNVLAVRVDATEPEGWWYEGCGIYRHVWLHIVDRLYFDINGLWWTTPQITHDQAEICIHAKINNDYEEMQNFDIEVAITAPDTSNVANFANSFSIDPGQQEVTLKTIINNPELWTPDHPALYQIEVSLKRDGKLLETRQLNCGIRSFEFDADKGFSLNGKPMKLLGVNCHQDFAGVGVALPDRLHEKRVEIVKEMGANSFRCAHNPPALAFLEACDRLGLLVINENRSMDTSPEGLNDLKLLIERDRKHPSVIAWSLFNEEFATTRPLAQKAIKTLAKFAHQLDPTRPLTFAGNNFADDRGGTQAVCWQHVDLVGRNYGWEAYDKEHDKHPEFVAMASELSALHDTRDTYLSEDGNYLTGCELIRPVIKNHPPLKDLASDLEDLTVHWKAVAEREFISGGFIWCLMDFRGECTWPRIHTGFGIMDLCGFPKDSYYYFKAWWNRNEPLVHLFPHWTWNGYEGQTIYLRAFSNCKEVELVVNGQSQGRQKMPEYGLLEWPVVYTPGKVEVIGYNEGVEVIRDCHQTAGPAVEITADPDCPLNQNNENIVCLTVQLKDENGTPVYHDDHDIKIDITGGKLLGAGSGDPCDYTLDSSPVRKTFRGKCLFIVKADQDINELTVKLSSRALRESMLKCASDSTCQ